jgi:hypothetical protein
MSSHRPLLRFARLTTALRLALLFGLVSAPLAVRAEPYLAVQNGFKCSQCHVNPTGGGLRNTFGDVFSQTLMPMQHIDTGTDVWTGNITKFLAVGGNVRADYSIDQVRNQPSVSEFSLVQARVYLDASVIPDRLLVYVDEQVGPGGAINREAYGVYWSANHDWYVKGGQMYLPFGFRLQDQGAFVQQVSGIDMTTPDQGVEVGYLHGRWDAQLDLTNGTAGGPVTHSGKQFSGQLQYVEQRWRLGLALNENNSAGEPRRMVGLFGGLKTGPVGWLAEADLVDDQTLPYGQHKSAAGLLEADWLIMRGNNLKITAEEFKPDTSVQHNEQSRWSIVYELTPIQFVQIRTGFRYTDGIPQADSQHGKLFFVELHAFF